jgi:hypothetical protein
MPEAIKPQFYVYVLRDPRPGKNLQPIYVGKGKGKRARQHWFKFENHVNSMLRRVFAKIHAAGLKPTIEIVCYADVEADAFTREIELISKYGRRDLGHGTLCNLTDGGEGAAGCLIAAENMRKLRADPDFCKAIARGMQKRNADPEFVKAREDRGRKSLNNLRADPEFAKAAAERSREHMLRLHADPEFRKAHSERASERARHPSPALVRSWVSPSAKTRKARSENLKRLHANPEYAKAHSERMKRRNADPQFAKAKGERMRRLHANPDFAKRLAVRARAQMQRLNADPEFKAKSAAAVREANKGRGEESRKRWADPEFRTKASAAMAKAWIKRRAKTANQPNTEI